VLHPAQVPVVNDAFTPAVEEYWRALAAKGAAAGLPGPAA